MNNINELMTLESDIIQKRRQGKFANKADLRIAIEKLLDEINFRRKDIETLDEWEWACSAIIHWDSFLRSLFGTCKGIRLPRLREIRRTKKRIDYVEKPLKAKAEDLSILELKETLKAKITEAVETIETKMSLEFRESREKNYEEHLAQLEEQRKMMGVEDEYLSMDSFTTYRS